MNKIKYLLCIILILIPITRTCSTVPDLPKQEVVPEVVVSKDSIKVKLKAENITGTVYNAVESQCDGDPLHTADGTYIDKSDIENLNYIAISRDLEQQGFKMGDIVEIYHEDEDICGIYEIHDRMHQRWTNRIDFLMPDHVVLGKWDSITITKLN